MTHTPYDLSAQGWRESTPGEQGVDAARLAEGYDQLTAEYPHFDSLIIVRRGCIVFERYRGDSGPEVLHNLKSVTKSVLSMLIGIAIQTGDLEGLDGKLGYYFPDYFTSTRDSNKRDIRVRDLLTMRSGLEWSEWGSCAVEMTASPHWIDFVLEQPLIHRPGEHFSYSTGDTQLLSGILQRATAMSALDFADLYLFGPLGITQRSWPSDPQGYTIGGAELSLTPRDMAKLGALYLNQGIWAGDSVIPTAWVKMSTAPHVEGVAADPGVRYGYLWWLYPQASHECFIAAGYGGQLIYGIPDLDLVVVLAGDSRAAPKLFSDNRMVYEFSWLRDWVIPAVSDIPG